MRIPTDLLRTWERILTAQGMPAEILNVESCKLRRVQVQTVMQKREYFTRAQQWLHVLESVLDARVWELHSEGKAVRFIAEDTGCSKSEVHRIIKRIRIQAGLSSEK